MIYDFLPTQKVDDSAQLAAAQLELDLEKAKQEILQTYADELRELAKSNVFFTGVKPYVGSAKYHVANYKDEEPQGLLGFRFVACFERFCLKPFEDFTINQKYNYPDYKGNMIFTQTLELAWLEKYKKLRHPSHGLRSNANSISEALDELNYPTQIFSGLFRDWFLYQNEFRENENFSSGELEIDKIFAEKRKVEKAEAERVQRLDLEKKRAESEAFFSSVENDIKNYSAYCKEYRIERNGFHFSFFLENHKLCEVSISRENGKAVCYSYGDKEAMYSENSPKKQYLFKDVIELCRFVDSRYLAHMARKHFEKTFKQE